MSERTQWVQPTFLDVLVSCKEEITTITWQKRWTLDLIRNFCAVLNFCAPKIGHIFWPPAISTFDRTQKQRHGDANGDGLTKTHLPHFSLTAAGEVGFTVIELQQNFTPPDLRQNLRWLNYGGWCSRIKDKGTPVGESRALIGPNLWLPLAATRGQHQQCSQVWVAVISGSTSGTSY